MFGIGQWVTKAKVALRPKPKPVPKVVDDVSSNGLSFITHFEGVVLHPYDDGGRPGVGNATIGVGHLIHMGPCTATDQKKYRGFTEADAEKLLRQDAQTAVSGVKSLGIKLAQTEFDALVSFAFNCGNGALDGGIRTSLREGDKAIAMGVLKQYNKAGGQVLGGLVTRREAEANLFLHGVYVGL